MLVNGRIFASRSSESDVAVFAGCTSGENARRQRQAHFDGFGTPNRKLAAPDNMWGETLLPMRR
jgi:hypothetical protein